MRCKRRAIVGSGVGVGVIVCVRRGPYSSSESSGYASDGVCAWLRLTASARRVILSGVVTFDAEVFAGDESFAKSAIVLPLLEVKGESP